jgi:hypothetical protein
MHARLYANNFIYLKLILICLHSTLGMHKGLQKRMLKFMCNEILLNDESITLSIQNFVEVLLLVF